VNCSAKSEVKPSMQERMPKEDQWAFLTIGSSFPAMSVKVIGQQNMHIALWYKHGKPVYGRAWSNGGLLECSFPYNNAELTGAKDLEGQIQVLQYIGDHRTLGFWYNWIKYSQRFDKEANERQLLKCENSMPILWINRRQGALLGNLDNRTEIASFSHDGQVDQLSGKQLDEMLIIVRELNGEPPNYKCQECLFTGQSQMLRMPTSPNLVQPSDLSSTSILMSVSVCRIAQKQRERELQPPVQRAGLLSPASRSCLPPHINIDERKNLCFDIGTDYKDKPRKKKYAR